jgi:hypothetical protein
MAFTSAPETCTGFGVQLRHITKGGIMHSKITLDELSRRITGLIPENLAGLQTDLEANVRAVLQNALQKMNLVTREEFDVQAALLARTREKLDALQQQLDALKHKR